MSNLNRISQKVCQLITPTVDVMGYELVGVEFLPSDSALLRIYIDNPAGITVDDCQMVSQQVSGILDVEDPIVTNYTLEVSSPGLERPLFTLAHFEQYIGRAVKIKLAQSIEGRRNFKGIVKDVADGCIFLQLNDSMSEDTNLTKIQFNDVDKANLMMDDIFVNR